MAEETISIQVVDDIGELKSAVTTTRTETIERMAKGLAKYNDPVKQAEAALDALIKGE